MVADLLSAWLRGSVRRRGDDSTDASANPTGSTIAAAVSTVATNPPAAAAVSGAELKRRASILTYQLHYGRVRVAHRHSAHRMAASDNVVCMGPHVSPVLLSFHCPRVLCVRVTLRNAAGDSNEMRAFIQRSQRLPQPATRSPARRCYTAWTRLDATGSGRGFGSHVRPLDSPALSASRATTRRHHQHSAWNDPLTPVGSPASAPSSLASTAALVPSLTGGGSSRPPPRPACCFVRLCSPAVGRGLASRIEARPTTGRSVQRHLRAHQPPTVSCLAVLLHLCPTPPPPCPPRTSRSGSTVFADCLALVSSRPRVTFWPRHCLPSLIPSCHRQSCRPLPSRPVTPTRRHHRLAASTAPQVEVAALIASAATVSPRQRAAGSESSIHVTVAQLYSALASVGLSAELKDRVVAQLMGTTRNNYVPTVGAVATD